MKKSTHRVASAALICLFCFSAQAQSLTDTFTLQLTNYFWKTGEPINDKQLYVSIDGWDAGAATPPRWVPVTLTSGGQLNAAQLGLKYDTSLLSIKNVRSEILLLQGSNVLLYSNYPYISIAAYTTDLMLKTLAPSEALFEIQVEALQSCTLSQAIALSHDFLPALWVDSAMLVHPFDTTLALVSAQYEPVASGVQIGKPAPNPFREKSSLSVLLEKPSTVYLKVSDASGRICQQKSFELSEGQNTLEISPEDGSASGVLFYQIWSENWRASGKVIQQ